MMRPELVRNARLLAEPPQVVGVDLDVTAAVREDKVVLPTKDLEKMRRNHRNRGIIQRIDLCAIPLTIRFWRLDRISANLQSDLLPGFARNENLARQCPSRP